jgi:hypothetical protein
MVDSTKVRIYAFKSRHSINLPTEFIRDSAFPFKIGEELMAKIVDEKIVIQRGKKQ